MSPVDNFTVDAKEEVRTLDKAGAVVVMYRIWATTRKGTYFHIDVPEAQLDKAHDLLKARAEKLDAI